MKCGSLCKSSFARSGMKDRRLGDGYKPPPPPCLAPALPSLYIDHCVCQCSDQKSIAGDVPPIITPPTPVPVLLLLLLLGIGKPCSSARPPALSIRHCSAKPHGPGAAARDAASDDISTSRPQARCAERDRYDSWRGAEHAFLYTPTFIFIR